MFFDVTEELYLCFFTKVKVPITRIIILSLKIFWNMFLFCFILTVPYILMLLITK